MTGGVTRRIALAQQIEEMQLLVGEQRTELPGRGRRDRIPTGIVEERLGRQAGILETLIWCRDHEHEIRQWASERASARAAEQAEEGKTDDDRAS